MDSEMGIVERTEEGWAWVLTQRGGGCEHCGHKGHCGVAEGGTDRMIVKAENTAHARIGDEVEVYLSNKTKLKNAFIVYMFPVLGLLAGAISGSRISGIIGLKGDLGTVIFSVFGLILAFLLARVFEARMKANRDLIPVVSRIRRQADTEPPHHEPQIC